MYVRAEFDRLIRLITTSPLWATGAAFCALMLLLLIGSLGHRAPSMIGLLHASEILLPVALCFGVAVFVRQSLWIAALKPSWISWGGVSGLALQAVVAALFIYVAIGNWLGFVHPSPNAISWWVALPMAVLALVAVVGIYRNEWWAYFLEVVLLWTLIALAMRAPSTPNERYNALKIPFFEDVEALAEWASFLVFSWKMLRQGLSRYRTLSLTTEP